MSLPPLTTLGINTPLPRPAPATPRTDAHAADDDRLRAASEPLALLYRSAIARLNETLQPELGNNAIQAAADSGDDFSPRAVADRILSFISAGLAGYRERHPHSGQDEQLNGFLSLVRGAIEQGFAEARKILHGLGVLNGTVADNADQTYRLIQDGLDRFARGNRAVGDEAG